MVSITSMNVNKTKLPATKGFTIVHCRLWNMVHGSNLNWNRCISAKPSGSTRFPSAYATKNAERWKRSTSSFITAVFFFFQRCLIRMVKWLATVIFSIESDFCQVSKIIVWIWVNSNYDTRTKKPVTFKSSCLRLSRNVFSFEKWCSCNVFNRARLKAIQVKIHI